MLYGVLNYRFNLLNPFQVNPKHTPKKPSIDTQGSEKSIQRSSISRQVSQILQCLSIQGLASSSGSDGVSRALVKERFRIFNVHFEELHQRQSQWTVPDIELRQSLVLAVSEVLLPAYRSLLRFGAYRSHWNVLRCCYVDEGGGAVLSKKALLLELVQGDCCDS